MFVSEHGLGSWGGAATVPFVERVGANLRQLSFELDHCRRPRGGPALFDLAWLTRTVTIRDDIEPAAQLKTLFHEAGHVLGHSPEADVVPTCRGIKEVEAESIAFIVSASLGIDTSTYSFPYIGHWMAGVGELAAAQATAERVITIARHILDDLDD